MLAVTNRDWRLLGVLVVLSVMVGAAVLRAPVVAAGLAVGTLLVTLGVVAPGIVSRAFLGAVAVLLAGYALLGKPFAYLHVSALFIGEAVLALGLLAALLDRRRWDAFRSPLTWVIVAFGAWGAARTLPYLGEYGIDALRDAVVWGYGVFVVLLVPVLLRGRTVETVPALYARFVPWLLLWAPVAMVLRIFFDEAVPSVPGTDISLLGVKPGDFGVHLGGAAAFLLLGLHRAGPGAQPGKLRLELLWWIPWLVGFLAVSSTNRGGMLAALAAVFMVAFLRMRTGGKRLVRLGAVTTVFTLVLLVFGLSLEFGGRRDISPQQIVENVSGIAGPGAEGDGTRRWRLQWWGEIVGYTILGEHFWTGKGFGINLATDDGFQASPDGSLRSPHSGHLTVLARTGVPGLAVWLVLQVGFALALLRASFRARRAGREWWSRLYVWVLAYWAAFTVNIAFDVYLEGPQGGIWFWSLMAYGIAALLLERDRASARPPIPERYTMVTDRYTPLRLPPGQDPLPEP